MGVDVLDLAVELRRTGEAFALATVVRCERPTSAKPGAKALIRGDGARHRLGRRRLRRARGRP